MKASVPTAIPPEMSISVATPKSPVGDRAKTPSEAAVTTASRDGCLLMAEYGDLRNEGLFEG